MSLAYRARRATRLSQRGFARLIGVHHVTVANWETGKKLPGAATVALLRLIEAQPRAALEVLKASVVAHVPEWR